MVLSRDFVFSATERLLTEGKTYEAYQFAIRHGDSLSSEDMEYFVHEFKEVKDFSPQHQIAYANYEFLTRQSRKTPTR